MKEPLRYLDNAKETLRKSTIESGYYTDIKYVKGAFGIAWSGILEAIDEYLVSKKHVPEKELPHSKEEYQKALRKHVAHRNGKLQRIFNDLYNEIHMAGYYRGDLRGVKVVKAVLNDAKAFIEKLW